MISAVATARGGLCHVGVQEKVWLCLRFPQLPGQLHLRKQAALATAYRGTHFAMFLGPCRPNAASWGALCCSGLAPAWCPGHSSKGAGETTWVVPQPQPWRQVSLSRKRVSVPQCCAACAGQRRGVEHRPSRAMATGHRNDSNVPMHVLGDSQCLSGKRARNCLGSKS